MSPAVIPGEDDPIGGRAVTHEGRVFVYPGMKRDAEKPGRVKSAAGRHSRKYSHPIKKGIPVQNPERLRNMTPCTSNRPEYFLMGSGHNISGFYEDPEPIREKNGRKNGKNTVFLSSMNNPGPMRRNEPENGPELETKRAQRGTSRHYHESRRPFLREKSTVSLTDTSSTQGGGGIPGRAGTEPPLLLGKYLAEKREGQRVQLQHARIFI